VTGEVLAVDDEVPDAESVATLGGDVLVGGSMKVRISSTIDAANTSPVNNARTKPATSGAVETMLPAA
jgi:hypothetical protein